jgi:hypothetical protein
MMKQWQILLWLGIGLGMLATGCTPAEAPEKDMAVGGTQAPAPPPKVPALLNKYKTGQSDRVHWSRQEIYNTWVEMPDEEPSQKRGRNTKIELVLACEVEAVEDDGSAIMKITFEKANLHMVTRQSEDKEVIYDYNSTAEGTKVSQGTEPALAGASYRIKVGPDSSVREIMDIDKLRQKLNLKEDAVGTAVHLISEENIKGYHERAFLLSGVGAGGSAEKMSAVSNVMVKAQAINKTFTAGPVTSKDSSKIVTVTSTAQPVHTLPEGIGEPPQPNDFGRTIVKQMSDMQKYENTGISIFDVSRGKVISDQNKIDCTLILLGDKIGQMGQGQKKPPKGSGGEMFTVVSVEQQFKVLP